MFSYDEAKSSRNRFESDYRLSRDSIYGRLEVDAEFKGTWKGALWINKYQFKRMDPDVRHLNTTSSRKPFYAEPKKPSSASFQKP